MAEKDKEHFAHIAFYVKDANTSKVYGITNKHVALHARNAVFIKKDAKTRLCFGTPLSIANESTQDIGLIEINEQFNEKVCNQITDQYGQCRALSLFNGNKEELYGKKVVKCLSGNFSRSRVSNLAFGVVVKKELDENDHLFYVQGENFAAPGDSGTAVALDYTHGSGVIEVVGVVGGGQEYTTCCLYIPSVLEQLNIEYKMDLRLFIVHKSTTPESSNILRSKKETCKDAIEIVEGCVTIFFHLQKTPDQISPYNFDLAKKVVTYTGVRFDDLVVYPKVIWKFWNTRRN